MQENLFAEMLVSKDRTRATLTVMRPISIPNDKAIRVYPKGLDKNKRYFVSESELTLSGKNLMNLGLIVNFENCDFATKVFNFNETT